jgi:hypothetical protein
MEFSPKEAARTVMHSLCTARDHAWRYKMMDPKKLYIGELGDVLGGNVTILVYSS